MTTETTDFCIPLISKKQGQWKDGRDQELLVSATFTVAPVACEMCMPYFKFWYNGNLHETDILVVQLRLRCISRIDSYLFKVEGVRKLEMKVLIFRVGKLWWLRRWREVTEYREVVTLLVGDAPQESQLPW
ncbi:hypothetical protein Tco_0851219 [Tanacetum coccineum]